LAAEVVVYMCLCCESKYLLIFVSNCINFLNQHSSTQSYTVSNSMLHHRLPVTVDSESHSLSLPSLQLSVWERSQHTAKA